MVRQGLVSKCSARLQGLIKAVLFQGFKFRLVGPPTANEIVNAAANDAIRALDNINADTLKQFEASAEKLIAEKGAVTALSAALAIISGSTEIKARSMLNSREVRYIHWSFVI